MVAPPVNQNKVLNSGGGTPNKANSNDNDPYNKSVPLFMVAHVQNQRSSANKLFPENSPERKSHDAMLISPHKHVIKQLSASSHHLKS